MTLVSPGVEIDIIDQSQYVPAGINTVPYVLLATAQNKVSGAGVGIAAGTKPENANKVYLITSQRDLAATYGVPLFYKSSNGTPIDGYELNEYGLLAAYSALGLSNRCYVQRVDVDLNELTPTTARPKGDPNNGTYWLNTKTSNWGLFEWNQVTAAFTNKIPSVIDNINDLEPNFTVPLQSYGSIGDYAVVAIDDNNPTYYKRGGATSTQTSASQISDLYNMWVLVGSEDWQTAWPSIYGTLAPSTLIAGNTIVINGTIITVPDAPNNTVVGLEEAINAAAIAGVYASVIGGKLNIYGNNQASAGSDPGFVEIRNGLGNPLAALGITPKTYSVPQYQATPSYTVPRWRTTDTTAAPTGSVWQKTNNVNLGANIVLNRYDSTVGAYIQQACPLYQNDAAANYALDPSGGGLNIKAGSTYDQLAPFNDNTATSVILQRYSTGPTIIVGDTPNPGPFTIGDTFGIEASAPNKSTYNTGTATLTGTTPADFVAAISAAAVPYVSASINANGYIVITHQTGGSINMTTGIGFPFFTAGFNPSVRGVRAFFIDGQPDGISLSNWVGGPTFNYFPSDTAPDEDPNDGTLWYYSATNQVDIMVQNNGQWYGYQNVTNDVRGYNLSLTNASGPIFSVTPPTTQNDVSQSPLQYGDIWIDTSDLENYPLINRWSTVNGQDQWVLLDNADGTTENGVIFQDARWGDSGDINPITDPYPTIESLLTSDYLDLDAPEPDLYPQGMLLFNTRRSGYNVKRFAVNYFNPTTYPDAVLPTERNAWVTQSGNRQDGSPYMGGFAQRSIIVAALKSGIDTSVGAREDARQFNLISCPQYPELIQNMVALNNERGQTAFVVGDTPLRLDPQSILGWASGTLPSDSAPFTIDPIQGLVGDTYAGVFYPSCTTTDTTGSLVVQPPSHMMLRAIIHNDQVAYPWFAPAGTRRGVVDNALTLGYIDGQTSEFQTINVNQGLRDVLYENNINPLTFIPGVGITNYGNKTTYALTTALDRINVSRLVAYVRAQLETIAKQYLFEPNDQITRNEISNAITSMLTDIVAKRGIYDYLVVCDLTNNTPARIDRNELWVDIAIEPVKAVEFIYIPVRIMNTGEIATLTSAAATTQ